MKNLPNFTIQELMDVGAHFGHRTMRWNPKMSPYLFGSRDNIHIIDLQKTVPLLYKALEVVHDVVKNNGRVLFVGTKRQATDVVSEAAKRCGQYYVNHRWLGGMLTNLKTISKSIKTMIDLENILKAENDNSASRLTKKELLQLSRKYQKLECSLGGIREMGGKPDLIFVIDTNKESLAIQEANKLGIPVIAILDSNSNPDGVTYPVPGNDDATKAIRLYCKLISDAALEGIKGSLVAAGVDVGSIENGDVLSVDRSKVAKNNAKKPRKMKTEKDSEDKK